MLLALVLVGCGRREDLPGATAPEPITWETCGEMDCATLRVPIDRFASPSERADAIDLRIYRQISPVAGSRHLPLVIHPGGPGADVRAAVARARSALAPIVDDFDIYALSTRGSVDGTAFDCGESLSDLRIIDSDPGAVSRFAKRCTEVSAALAGNIGTHHSVEDLEELRATLGFEKVRFLGWSYGATLGAAWAMTHPRSIRSMVLDAPSDPRRPWTEELRERYVVASDVFARSSISTSLDTAGNARESALAREYFLYEPNAGGSGSDLTALRLGETPDGKNDGGIETQIGVHCSDVSHADARAAIALAEPTPRIGFGAAFDRVCLALPESERPLTRINVDPAATRVDAMVVSTVGDHVIPAVVSQRLAKDMLWRSIVVEADRHLSVGFDAVATKKAMAFLATGD